MKDHPIATLVAGVCAAFVLLLATAGCGDAAQPDDAGPGGAGAPDTASDGSDGGASGRILWAVTITYLLSGLDLGSGEQVGNSGLEQVPVDTTTGFAAVGDRVWVASSGGQIGVSDAATGKLLDTLDLDTLALETPQFGVGAFAADDRAVYAAYSVHNDGARLIRIDAASHAVLGEVTVPSDLDPTMVVDQTSVRGMVVDADTLWLLRAGTFALLALDPTTLEVRDTVPLGSYGSSGRLAYTGDAFLVLTQDEELLRVDKASREVTAVADLSEYLDRQVSRSSVLANSDSFFLTNLDDDSSVVHRFDAVTGAHLASYEFGEEGARAAAVTDDRLYVNEDRFGELLEIDIDSGETLRTFGVLGVVALAIADRPA